MEYQNLIIEENEGILLLTINREKALNALNSRTIDELTYFFGTDGPARTNVKGIIITGAGNRSFVAGADIKEFLSLGAQGGAKMAKKGQDCFFLIERFPKPVIAAVNGFALGGGCELAMACHMRVAGEFAKFGQPEVNLGIIPGYGGTQRLTQLVGKGKAIELMTTGDMIKADEAYRLGLANHVVPAGEEVAKAKEILGKIMTKAPVAITKVLECVNKYYEHNGNGGFDSEIALFGDTTLTSDFQEGATAFIEKRAANFKGE